ncbi:bifunctional 2-polyprenyl-6-hydroxyphenol methylase/3-demethylubiquinol 3-O-methyltransferase UbiG [Roseivirga sp. E12]|uniref:class I SAM-dependent methyltransferase n=1 Tax=Roseivirga sp. E12 TaxID=2819237 RepID=UPI001ABC9E83|nr:class I SAM-dependent methyltransferase [Roseivirga sp. E12]MBO3698387.1 class I SAM-dependent methyltransferase [Roseivirga sp. E12]
MKDIYELVELNSYGFYQIKNIPNKQELKEYYADKYYQNEVQYQHQYLEEEKQYIYNKISQKAHKAYGLGNFQDEQGLRLLDVGCGEGWTLDYFDKKGWDVTGADFSKFGVETQNSQLKERVHQGDLEDTLKALLDEGQQYDLIWLDNVLEHVINPLLLLETCAALAKEGGLLLVEVPNDFSSLQKYLSDKEKISKPFWVSPPDHLSYFSQEGLDAVAKEAGWGAVFAMCDFPIDMMLLLDQTNYVEKSEVGKSCHLMRVEFENFIHRQGSDKVNAFYEAMSGLGLGREIIGYYKKA